jgi:hypothetical protein
MAKLLRLWRRYDQALYTGVLIGLGSVLLQAQGDPFTLMATKVSASAVIIARILGVVAMIFGGLRMAMGDHNAKGSIGTMAIGLGIAIFAPQIMAWLFV